MRPALPGLLALLTLSLPFSDEKVVLVGLHTCGDLATVMLRLMAETTAFCALVSVPCCYRCREMARPPPRLPTNVLFAGRLLAI